MQTWEGMLVVASAKDCLVCSSFLSPSWFAFVIFVSTNQGRTEYTDVDVGLEE